MQPQEVQGLRELIRGNLATRDELHAAAEELQDEETATICQRMADTMGGHAAHLQQLLASAQEPDAEPIAPEEIVRLLQEVVVEMLNAKHGPAAVLDEAAAAQHRLMEKYEAALRNAPDPDVKALLEKQRDEVAFGETVLKRIQSPKNKDERK